jgi:hypothetical protein
VSFGSLPESNVQRNGIFVLRLGAKICVAVGLSEMIE